MTDYEKVVEIVGEASPSLLELAKKWFIQWAIKPKELLATFHKIRKAELRGFLIGTHEIKPKSSIQKTGSLDQDFECIYTSELITIPDMDIVVADCKELWGELIGSAPVPEGLKSGIQKRVKIIRINKDQSSQNVINHLKKYAGAILPNIFGLRIAELNDAAHLPGDICIRGLDERENLLITAYGCQMVPSVYYYSDGRIIRCWPCRYRFDQWMTDDYFMILCD